MDIARQLKRQFSDATVTIIEKENHCGAHASGRNSGALHAGLYYSPESLKAKFTRLGNKRLTEYCESKQIPMNRCGKLVVAKDCSEHQALDELLRRGKVNDIDLQAITEEEANAIEPRVKTCQRALFSPTTSTNIYPVPDLRNPFLGVHVTVTSEGKSKIGPTAIPAFWREQYSGFENLSVQECGSHLKANASFRVC